MGKRFLFFFLAGSLLFFSFVSYSYLVHKDTFTQTDFDTTVKLQNRIPRFVDNEFSFLSDIGSFEVVTIFLILFLPFALRWRALLVVFFYCLFHSIELFGKIFVTHHPPPEFMVRTERLFQMNEYYVRPEFSYPSGHAGRAAFVSIILGFIIWRSKRLPLVFRISLVGLLVIYDVLMFVSRVYLGEHWSTDVIGGSLLGFACGLLALSLVRSRWK